MNATMLAGERSWASRGWWGVRRHFRSRRRPCPAKLRLRTRRGHRSDRPRRPNVNRLSFGSDLYYDPFRNVRSATVVVRKRDGGVIGT